MSYIGKKPLVGNFVKLDTITTSATTTFNLTNGGVAYYPQSANNCLVSLNGILQAPTDSYTISGSTIVFSSALTTSDVIDFIIVLGDVLNIGTPSDNTVSLAKLTATGTKDSTTFLRGDNTFAVPPAGAVLQVVTATDSTERSTTSTSYVTASNTLSASITPASSSNKVFVMVTTSGYSSDQTFYTIYRGATNLGGTGTDNAIVELYSIGGQVRTSITLSLLDSPATTSSTTYQVYLKTNATGKLNQNNTKGSITLFEIKG